jgi:hypothetical protein
VVDSDGQDHIHAVESVRTLGNALYDPDLNCHIRLPLDSLPVSNRAAGIQHTFEAVGDDFIIKVRAIDRDDKTDFNTASLIDRNIVVLSKGNAVAIDDEGACTIGTCQAYMVNVTGGKKDERIRSDVVYVDGPDGRMFVLTGESAETDWPQAKASIESCLSTFAPGR